MSAYSPWPKGSVGVLASQITTVEDLKLYALTDEQSAVAEVKGEGLIKSTGRMYRQDYVVFLRAAEGKIAFIREYFDPVRAAKALDTPILDLES
jgi:uncharacterized protein